MTNTQRASNSSSNCKSSSVTELILANDSLEQLSLILPMIAFLSQSHSDRWISWISPQTINRQLLESYGVNTQRLRFIHCADGESARWITWEALASGTSHTVIACPGKLQEQDLIQLEEAAFKGQSRGILLRLR